MYWKDLHLNLAAVLSRSYEFMYQFDLKSSPQAVIQENWLKMLWEASIFSIWHGLCLVDGRKHRDPGRTIIQGGFLWIPMKPL